jgi:hypothetical protein
MRTQRTGSNPVTYLEIGVLRSAVGAWEQHDLTLITEQVQCSLQSVHRICLRTQPVWGAFARIHVHIDWGVYWREVREQQRKDVEAVRVDTSEYMRATAREREFQREEESAHAHAGELVRRAQRKKITGMPQQKSRTRVRTHLEDGIHHARRRRAHNSAARHTHRATTETLLLARERCDRGACSDCFRVWQVFAVAWLLGVGGLGCGLLADRQTPFPKSVRYPSLFLECPPFFGRRCVWLAGLCGVQTHQHSPPKVHTLRTTLLPLLLLRYLHF